MHPELDENREKEVNLTQETDSLFENKESSKVFERAVSKLSTSGYEILGTEQIISSILEDKDSNLTKILADFGVTEELFEEKLSKIQSRQAEYEGRQIVFTPNAFTAMSLALQTAKELGSSEVLPEHMILGLLKTKKGVAYNIFKELKINDDDLAHGIIKPIEKQMPETLTILRLAKQEARRLGKGIVVTKRAKRVLETAWEHAKKANKTKIESSDLLWAITTEPTSLAMQALEQLGTDVVELREGIKKHSAIEQ